MVSAPAVPLGANSFFVDEPHVNDVLYAGQDGIGSTGPRFTGLIRDIRNEDDVTTTDVETEVDYRTSGRWHIVPMQVVRISLIEINHQRILFVLIKSIRLIQQAGQFLTVVCRPICQLNATPRILLLLWIRFADSFDRFELHVRCPNIGEATKGAAGKKNSVGCLSLDETAQAFRQHQTFLQWRLHFFRFIVAVIRPLFIFYRAIAIEPAVFVFLVECCQEHIISINEPGFAIQSLVPEADRLLSAHRLSNTNRFRLATWIQFPNVVAIIDQHRIIVGRPAGDAVRTWIRRCIMQLIPKRKFNRLGQIDFFGANFCRHYKPVA